MFIYVDTHAHIMRFSVLYDNVQCWDDTVGVKLRYILIILITIIILCRLYTGSGGDKLETKPKPTRIHMPLGQMAAGIKQTQTIAVWSSEGRHQAEGLLHIAFDLSLPG